MTAPSGRLSDEVRDRDYKHTNGSRGLLVMSTINVNLLTSHHEYDGTFNQYMICYLPVETSVLHGTYPSTSSMHD